MSVVDLWNMYGMVTNIFKGCIVQCFFFKKFYKDFLNCANLKSNNQKVEELIRSKSFLNSIFI